MAKTCSSCGKTYEIDISFCLECGAKLVESEIQQPPAQESSEVAPTFQVEKAPQEMTEPTETVMPTQQTPPVTSSKPISKHEEEAQLDLLSDLSDKVASISASLETVAQMNLLLLKKINKIDNKISALLPKVEHRKEEHSRE